MSSTKFNDKMLLLPKQLSQMILDAVARIRGILGHESFAPAGYQAFKDISEYKLKSNGSLH